MLVATAAFGIVLACASASYAQPKVGGYKVAKTDAPEVVAAAEFAVTAQNEKDDFGRTLISVLSAEHQLVAGTNYRMCLKVKLGGDEGEIHYIKAVVYRDLKQVHKLTSWADDEACAAKDEEEADEN